LTLSLTNFQLEMTASQPADFFIRCSPKAIANIIINDSQNSQLLSRAQKLLF
jgi:hypothetical protein